MYICKNCVLKHNCSDPKKPTTENCINYYDDMDRHAMGLSIEKLAEFYQPLGMYQNLFEIKEFYYICEKIEPVTIVEIGAKVNGNIRFLSNLLKKDGLIVGIDVNKTPWKISNSNFRYHKIVGNSHDKETKNSLINILGERKIDILFIDGDHEYGGPDKDYKDYSPLVGKGGIIAFHDIYCLKPVIDYWNSFLMPGKKEIIQRNSENKPSGIGIGYFFVT